ncbi:hypothetical protein [Serratia marcescens]|uniref:hypothetical protein n=1 Tax=Serratia marcescens TaxID=615 RepID=UPI0006ECE4B0|nr:hypothetical protein [Serratia marcescens]ALL38449.1 hypothetical protein AR325_16275 [Serratia marcescens]PHI52895.1 hypothetical protein B9T65_05540 [Serratia marcescens]UJA52127.1 hypothetical protein L1F17_13960 [Serratia marcescens]
MYDPVKIDVKLEKYIIYNNLHDELEHTGNNIKVGVIFTLKYKESIESNCVAVIVSHWPSKITPGYEFRHKEAAEKLRDTAQDLIKDGFQVVLIGDYNLSPDEIIKDTPLQSYNNKFFATRSSLRLYNLGFHFLEQHSVCCRKINIPLEHAHGFGTFISSSNRAVETGCATFDYAHVGSSLIKDGPWIINEEDTRIFANQEIIDMIYGNASHLDHLPIIVSLMEKKMSNNPFSNVVKNSLVRVDNVAKAGSDLENYLVKASEALNDALSGPNEIFLTSDQDKTTAGLSGIINFIESANGVNRDTDKYIYTYVTP